MSVFRLIEAEKANFPIRFMCERLGVSPAGYYAWARRPASARALDDAHLRERICQIHSESRGTYGSPRVWAELRLGHGISCSRKRVARIMREAGLEGVHRRRAQRMRKGAHETPFSDDLVERSFTPAGPNVLWVADITQHPTWQGWLYAAVVIDAFSRKVVGWAFSDTLETKVVLEALDMALFQRRPGPGLVHHSDHGCQYTSFAFGRRLREAGIMASMGSVGDAYDNAVAESFFATLQTELLDRRSWATRRQLATAIFDYVEGFYNPRRRHSTLGYLSPTDYEAVTRPSATRSA